MKTASKSPGFYGSQQCGDFVLLTVCEMQSLTVSIFCNITVYNKKQQQKTQNWMNTE